MIKLVDGKWKIWGIVGCLLMQKDILALGGKGAMRGGNDIYEKELTCV